MSQPSKTRILAITREIHALELQMEPLKRKQAQLHVELEKALLGVDDEPTGSTGSGSFSLLSVKQRVEDYIVQHAGNWNAASLHKEMPDVTERTISATLSRLATGPSARIVRVANGQYSRREQQSNSTQTSLPQA